jgi:choline monooxygenase
MSDARTGELVGAYDATAPLESASTIPGSWYTDPGIYALERRAVFGDWQMVGRAEQVAAPGRFLTADVAGEPLLIARGQDGGLRGFFNVCRHHAALVATEPQGQATAFRCPYHGWTYSLDGELRGTPDFAGVCNFDRGQNGLVPVTVEIWENFVFARVNPQGRSLREHLGGLVEQVGPLGLERLHFVERRVYSFDSNWKVFVDNYLDGGYHIPYLHKGLDSVLPYSEYTIENGDRFCLQACPVRSSGRVVATAAVRTGARALYYWLHPNFMINWYEGQMDTNLVLPLGQDRTQVIFDFYFADISPEALERNKASIGIGDRIQDEDTGICASVQRGLSSRAYRQGRLSVRREAGEHLFHRLLAADLRGALAG